MSTTFDDPEGEYEPDPDDWSELELGEVSPEALDNDPDDVAERLVRDDKPLPVEADEADALAQRAEVPFDIDDEDPREA